MALVQAVNSKLSLSNRIYAILNLLSTEDAKVEIPERYEIYTQARYSPYGNGFIISVKPSVLHPLLLQTLTTEILSSLEYVLHVRCIEIPSHLVQGYRIDWWIANCGDDEHNIVKCCPISKPISSIKYHMFDEPEWPSSLSHEEILVAVAVIRNKLYRGAKELDAIYGVHQVMSE